MYLIIKIQNGFGRFRFIYLFRGLDDLKELAITIDLSINLTSDIIYKYVIVFNVFCFHKTRFEDYYPLYKIYIVHYCIKLKFNAKCLAIKKIINIIILYYYDYMFFLVWVRDQKAVHLWVTINTEFF